MTPAEIVESLKPCERKTLVACTLKYEREQARSRVNPMRVCNQYFAYAAEKRAARRLRELDLLADNVCFEGTGAEIYPSELGIKVAMAVLELEGVRSASPHPSTEQETRTMIDVKAIDESYRHAMAAKDLIFKAQDAVNYKDGLRELEDALLDIRGRLEAFDRLCRKIREH